MEGPLPPDDLHGERLSRICVSQDELSPNAPDQRSIERAFRDFGFIEIAEAAYYRPSDNVLFGDAYPRNLRIDNDIPFDAGAEHPDGAERSWGEARWETLRSRHRPPL